jgi:hypothetical protein
VLAVAGHLLGQAEVGDVRLVVGVEILAAALRPESGTPDVPAAALRRFTR